MKNEIFKNMQNIFNVVFSFGTYVAVAMLALVYAVITIASNENEQSERTRVAIELCYDQGMVLVSTDAGPRCAAPKNLVKIK